MAARGVVNTYALRRLLSHPQSIGGAMAVRRLVAQPLAVARCTALHWTQGCVQTEQSPSMHQCRWYVSKKKGSKHKAHEVDEEPAETDTMILDMEGMAKHMSHCVEGFTSELRLLRAGRANPAMLDRVRVKINNDSMLLPGMAMVTVKDAQNLLVIANDPDHKAAIDSAIRDANLGLNPRIDKNAIIVPVPKPTKESREKMVKDVEALAEHTRVNVRKYRHTAMKQLKADAKSSGMSKSEIKSWEKDIQAATDKHIDRIKDLITAKTHEIEKA
ncbi:hypothetical protein IW140_000963 [Coemansia sp. RSA 1813]|nr:hypothetical protein EV178_004811 [Coemansia sp. RSA 1646]KAJ1773367.1 hypothetical protein LPJ74_000620 [Coemansia sp. RSA 1843]KAJ2091585.1 hypothetical protein IW138_001813 [Coemansia sp. RSA 986]KAJ2212372.1 hypothetical protein EV179_004697 [Coemansia sp. RSA 487]KAJ2572214.1 hypothetical protein IW140_000963 [Coemansia sp. RSA 1813]